jgi:hypothetical protein
MLTQNLTVSNGSKTITLNKDGATFKNCDITINKGSSILTLNATEGIKLMNGDSQQFFINDSGDAEFKGLITGGSLNINNKCIISSEGKLTAIDGDFGGKITATTGTIAGFSFTNDVTSGSFSAGTGSKFIRISPISTLNTDGTYNTSFGSIDLGLTPDGKESLIHLRSDGYARFGSSNYLGSVKLNYFNYALYSSNFAIEAETGFVRTNYIYSFQDEDLWLTGTRGVLLGADGGDAQIYGYNIQLNTIDTSGRFIFNDFDVLTAGNYSSFINTSKIAPSLTPAGNINFNGTENAAAVNWVQANYYTQSYINSNFATFYNLSSLDSSIRSWVSANFAPKA